jgi:hypothetical protein
MTMTLRYVVELTFLARNIRTYSRIVNRILREARIEDGNFSFTCMNWTAAFKDHLPYQFRVRFIFENPHTSRLLIQRWQDDSHGLALAEVVKV